MADDGKKSKPLALPDDCNVIDCSTGRQQFWRFAKGKSQMKLVHVRETELDEPIQAKHLERDTSQMWQPHCQNDAWLPSDSEGGLTIAPSLEESEIIAGGPGLQGR